MGTGTRSLRHALLLSAIIIAIAGMLAFDPARQSAQKKSSARKISAPKTSSEIVNLPGGAFDPRVTMRAGTVREDPGSFAASEEGYYIVQFEKTANDEMLERLRTSGMDVLQYVPNRAFFVYARGGAAESAIGNPDVRWVGRLLPEDKIPVVLAEQLRAARAKTALPDGVAAIQMASKRTAVFDVAVFKRADLKATADLIAAATGGTIRETIDLPGNFFNVVRLECSPDTVTRTADLGEVFRIDSWSKPVREDERAAQIVAGNYTSATVIDPPGYSPLAQFGVDGTGVTISVVDDGVGIPGDGGFYITSSNAVNGPLRGASAGAQGHGHLNASIIAGRTPFSTLDSSGYNYGIGVAPGSNIINIPLLRVGYSAAEASTVDDTVSTAGPNGIFGFISNNSWGNGLNGNTYDSYAAQYDGFARDASAAASVDPLLIVFSAGNSGASGLTRPKMSKNTISVANLENIRTELSAPANNMDDLNGTSSIGPAADGRIKPDLAAPGTAVAGGRSGTDSLFGNIDTFHRWSSGTSHAAPHVAGAAALFTQFWRSNNAGANPSPALVKAALINGAQDANGVSTSAAIPNGSEGWGRVYLKNVLNTGAAIFYVNETDRLAGTGAVMAYNGAVTDPSRPLRVTLVWTDPPAVADPALVNDLDLEVTVGDATYKGNVLSGGLSVAGGTSDALNNVENVFLPAGQAGPLSVRVLAKGINGDGVLGNADPTDQHFALVVHNGSVALDTAPNPVIEAPIVLTGNALLEPNECNQISIPLTNGGLTTATNVNATLATSTPGVSVFIANANYPDIAAGATAVNQTPFQISTGNTVACLSSVDLLLTITFAGPGSPLIYDLEMPVGRPGGINYTLTSSGGASISPGGSLVPGSTVDDAVLNFAAPFAFSVYGTDVASGSGIQLGTNGFAIINSTTPGATASANELLPSGGSGAFPANKPVLMPYWDDLDMRPTTTGGGIFTEITGSPGSRTLKIEWRARRWIASPSAAPFDTNFAIYFHEGSANFEYVYALTGTGPNASGASATVGVQAASAGAVYTQYSAFSGSLAPGQMINADIAAATCSSGGGPCIATSAPVSVSGRVVTPDGRGISGTRVTIAGENGTRMLSVTNGFGYFRFDGVPAGKSYVVSAAGRGYRFESQIVNITDSIADLTFVGLR